MGNEKKQDKSNDYKEIPGKDDYDDFSESTNHNRREQTIVNTNPPPRTPPKGRDKDNSED